MDVEASLKAADELQEEAALADSRRSDDRRQSGETLLDDRIAEREELAELGFASDERRFAARSRPWNGTPAGRRRKGSSCAAICMG